MIKINTKRLILKPLGIEYLKTVHAYASEPENTKYMVRLPNETIQETIDFLTSADNEWMKEQPSFYEFAVIYEDRQIGAVSIYLKENLSGELGWIINKKYWGQGFAYEAAEALLDYAKKELKIRHLIAHCDVDNTASYRIMEKLGMTRTGIYGGRKNKSSDEERTEYQYELYI